jgi:threonine synthase
MLYYSTQNPSHRVSFREAAIQGQAPDKGLYFPETIPTLPDGFIEKIETLSKEEIALQVIQPFCRRYHSACGFEKDCSAKLSILIFRWCR